MNIVVPKERFYCKTIKDDLGWKRLNMFLTTNLAECF